MNLVKIFIITLAAAAFAVSCGQPASTPNAKDTTANDAATATPAKPADTAGEAAKGAELYAKNCMICHKDTGKGGKMTIEGKSINPVDLTSDKMKKHDDEKLFGYISDGVPDEGMPAFNGKLSFDQITTIIKHVRTLQSK